ncbi:hypothetical protein P3102_07645 [Amycolatopsis sp. QT-25]|uniref:hypothetical protein n=1 Tax=Amycolatopsis sp. QT-25 TaxID=3034022 RepID=UPI0023EA9A9A|nr:hypothetical protein [Amycolatopsis sp. QT-25]WET81089.1 hypothetical protein P3102_07645 [Amycolatopsis sp. QT-25]
MVYATAPSPTLGRQLGKHLGRLVFTLIVGAVFLVASLPRRTDMLSRSESWEWLAEPAIVSNWLDTTLSDLPDLLTWLGYALLAYLGALLLVSLRHWKPGLFLIGVVVAVGTAALPHLLGGVGFVVFHVGAFLADVFVAVAGFFGDVAHDVLDFLVFVFTSWWWLAPAIIVVGLLVLWRPAMKGWAKPTLIALGFVAGVVVVFGGLGLLLGLIPESFWVTVGKVVGLLLVGLAVATVGQLFVDQIQGTMIAGSGRRGVIMGAIAVGSALAMLMLIGNILDAYSWYPDAMAAWLHDHLQNDGVPNLDISVALVIVSLSALGVISNLARLKPEPDLAKFRRSIIYAIAGGIAAIVVAAVAKDDQ